MSCDNLPTKNKSIAKTNVSNTAGNGKHSQMLGVGVREQIHLLLFVLVNIRNGLSLSEPLLPA